MNHYETKDQYLAALLLCFPDSNFNKTQSLISESGYKEVWYIFSDLDVSTEIVKAYFSDTLSLNPRLYVENLTKVRQMFKGIS